MLVTVKPPKKFCCSDFPALEAKILAVFSLISTCFCVFLLLLVYAHVQSKYPMLPNNQTQKSTTKDDTQTSIQLLCSRLFGGPDVDEEYLTTENEATEIVNSSNSSNITARVEDKPLNSNASNLELVYENELDGDFLDVDNELNRVLREQCGVKDGNSSKSSGMTPLESLANFMDWNKNTRIEWILIPFLWNGFDIIRAIVLLLAAKKNSMVLSKIWYFLTIAICAAGTGITVTILISISKTSFKIGFTHIFIVILLYNFYGLWIVYLFIKESLLTKESAAHTVNAEDKDNAKEGSSNEPVIPGTTVTESTNTSIHI